MVMPMFWLLPHLPCFLINISQATLANRDEAERHLICYPGMIFSLMGLFTGAQGGGRCTAWLACRGQQPCSPSLV